MRARNCPTVVSNGKSRSVKRLGAGRDGDRMWMVTVRTLVSFPPLGVAAAAPGVSWDAMCAEIQVKLCRMRWRANV